MKVRENVFGVLFEKSPNAISYQKILFDEQGAPCGFEFAGVNQAFETLFQLKASQVVGKRLSEVFEDVESELVSLLLKETAAGEQQRYSIETGYNSAAGPKRLRMVAFALDAHYFGMLYSDVTKEVECEKVVDEYQCLMDELKKTNHELRTLASTDELTGVCNRYHFERRVFEEMERADRYGEPLSMFIFDLDHFKRVNDTWGHPVGDAVLKQTASEALKVIRNVDVLSRWGGEEFIVLMPQTAYAGALAAAEKLRATLERYQHPYAGRVTASFGVAERMRAESFNHWYQRCDVALYRAKNSGRNCVVGCECIDGTEPIASVRLAWRREWESGNSTIDKQHRELVALSNNLINIAYAGVKQEQVMAQLEGLLNHICWHFEAEEEVLASVDYPDRGEHAELHKQLVAKAMRMKTLYQQHQLQMSAFFSFIIDDIVMGHMLKDDSRFFAYTRASA